MASPLTRPDSNWKPSLPLENAYVITCGGKNKIQIVYVVRFINFEKWDIEKRLKENDKILQSLMSLWADSTGISEDI